MSAIDKITNKYKEITMKNITLTLIVALFLCFALAFSAFATQTAGVEEIVPADHEHDYTAKVVLPTHRTDGYTEYFCACGHSYTDDIVEFCHNW
ncbi:MAG: hypothetical protein J6R96_04580, partial [Spirochaetaceae bacterium]|nr:hypothetical protein [Spirochaetaceae bacterium]